jgi:hypothetical protein
MVCKCNTTPCRCIHSIKCLADMMGAMKLYGLQCSHCGRDHCKVPACPALVAERERAVLFYMRSDGTMQRMGRPKPVHLPELYTEKKEVAAQTHISSSMQEVD